MSAIDRIDPMSYQTNRDHRSLADAILSEVGEKRDDCAEMELVNGTWFVTLLERTSDGKPFIRGGEIAKRIVTWPA